MIADDKRNGAYKAALARAIADVLRKQSTCDVLDVGAGSGNQTSRRLQDSLCAT